MCTYMCIYSLQPPLVPGRLLDHKLLLRLDHVYSCCLFYCVCYLLCFCFVSVMFFCVYRLHHVYMYVVICIVRCIVMYICICIPL